VQIGSVGQGIVKITETLGAWRFDYSQVSSWQDIKLSQNAVIITVSRSPLDTLTPSFIELSGRRISLDKSAIESSNLLSKQPASNIYLRAVESLYLNNLSSIDSRTFAEGDAGKIFVETPQLELDNFSSLSASAEEGSLGNGGEILIGASNFVKLSNGSAINVLTGASGNGGTIVIDSPQLSINTGAKIVAQTFAEGQGGNIKINVLDLDINGVSKNRVERSRIFVNSSFGEVELDVGDAGTIEITAKTLRVREGGLISARTETQGNGGNLVLNVSDSIEVTGTGEVFVFVQPTVRKLQIVPSTISSSSSGAGEAGNLQIKTGNLRILAGGIIEAGAISTGQAGDIFINTRTIELDRGEILTDNANLDGGNITLKASEFLTLRQGSTISTNAGADGGNISIVTPFILGVSQENSDITANADAGGRGGNININTQGIFGLEPREKPTNLSDITASSAFGTAGIVNINNSAIEAQEVTQELPNEPLDAALIIDQALCSVGRTNELTVSGRGGLPSNPEQLISGNQPWEDWRPGEETSQEPTPHTTVKETPRQLPLREFQGWAVNARGQIVLTAQANMVTPQGDWLPPFGCQNLR
jgi:large exoprotein involved in heme utilization and adhesion